MKTSSGLLLGVLFTLVVVIVAVVIYFNTRPGEEKPGTSTGPSSPTLPTIGDLTIAQTLSPNSDSETYTIEPYTIEYLTPEEEAAAYVEGDTEKKLSKNVKFTLKWENKGGFETVLKIQVEHYIRGRGTTAPLQTVDVPDSMKNGGVDGEWNYAEIEVVVTGCDTLCPDGNTKQYSFVGENMFKIVAMNANEQKITLYDGTADLVDGATHPPELVIKPEDLTASIDMTQSRTVTFDVSLLGGTRTTSKVIENISHTLTATTLDNRYISITGIEFISQDTTGTKFKFKNKASDTYLGVNKDATTGPLTLKTNASEADAAIITFAKSITKGDEYRMLKTVVLEKEYYLFGPHVSGDTEIKWLPLVGRESSQEERAMKDWKVIQE